MSIDEKTVDKVARLSRIHLSDEEKTHFAGEMNGILQWIEQLQEVDTEGVEQMTSVADVELSWRSDEVTDGRQRDAVLKNTPANEYGCFVVPKVIE